MPGPAFLKPLCRILLRRIWTGDNFDNTVARFALEESCYEDHGYLHSKKADLDWTGLKVRGMCKTEEKTLGLVDSLAVQSCG